MLFSTLEFILVFLPISIIGYYLFNRLHSPLWGKLWLLACSLFFYGWWNPIYLPLLLGSIAFNYYISRYIVAVDAEANPALRLTLATIGCLFNIFLLGYFKYANFFIDNINVIFEQNYFIEKIVLPLGISFFTIQQIAFLIDSYEGLAEEKNFFDYGLFVTFFPHLLAGPILHHKQMMPQFAESKVRYFDSKNFSIGLFLFTLGLFKKVAVADPLSSWVTAGYALRANLTLMDAWVTSFGYVFQVYYDFSGYVDMAIGIALMFNITLPKNFDSPYRATNIINFWERWHITLSKFISTYVLTPLVRNVPGKITFYKTMVAILVAMFIAGLWHGAAWTYVLFGVLHGVALVINHSWRRLKIKTPRWFGWLLTMVFINISFVVFRAGSFDNAFIVIKSMFGFYNHQSGAWYDLHVIHPETIQKISWLADFSYSLSSGLLAGSVLLVLLAISLFCKNSAELCERFQPNAWHALVQVLLITVSLFMMNGVTEFVYFQF